MKWTRILRQESPVTLAREAVWRAKRRRMQGQLPGKLAASTPVTFEPIGFHTSLIAETKEESKKLILEYSDRILNGRFSIFGLEEATLGFPPPWNLDFVSGKRWPMDDATEISATRFDGSDVKVPWELSRLQFLPVLGKAWKLTGDARYREGAKRLLDDWIEKNPTARGINWQVAMEAGLRAFSICLLLDLLSPFDASDASWLRKVTTALWHHVLFIEANLEFSYFLRSNHYLSNLFGLVTLSAFLRGHEAESRLARYERLFQQEIFVQTYEDGGDFEASIGYHAFVAQVFACGMEVLQKRGRKIDPEFQGRLREMFRLIREMARVDGRLPQIGDCDDGRVQLLDDDLRCSLLVPRERDSLVVPGLQRAGDAVLKTGLDAAEHSGERFVAFPKAGLARAHAAGATVIFCAVPNGIHGKGSHTHNDKLSVLVSIGGEELLCDSGTYVYTRDVAARNAFRATAAHNTLMVGDLEQNTISLEPLEAFRLGNEAQVSPITAVEKAGEIELRASHSGYERVGAKHSRTLHIFDRGEISIEDELAGKGDFDVSLFFQIAPGWRSRDRVARGQKCRCRFDGAVKIEMEWTAETELMVEEIASRISRAYGCATPSLRIRVRTRVQLPARIITKIRWRN